MILSAFFCGGGRSGGGGGNGGVIGGIRSIGCDGGYYGWLHAVACVDLSFHLSLLINLILVSVMSVHF